MTQFPPATDSVGVTAQPLRRTVLAAAAWSDWPLLGILVLLYSDLPGPLRPFDSDPLVVLLTAGLLVRRFVGRERFTGLGRPLAIAAVYACVGAASYLWAVDQAATSATLVRLGKNLVLFTLVIAAVRDERTLARAAWALVMVGVVLSGFTIYQRATGTFDNPYWGLANAPLAHVAGKVDDYRQSGPLSDPNCYGQILLPLLALAFGLFWGSGSLASRTFTAGAMLSLLLAVVYSHSRGGFLALCLVLGALVLAFRPRRRSGLVVIALVVAALPFVPRIYLERVKTFGMIARAVYASAGLPGALGLPAAMARTSPDDPFAEIKAEPGFRGRFSEIIVGVRMSLDHPIRGVGLGNYEAHYLRYARPLGIDKRNSPRQAHSLFVEIASETGLPGLALFLTLLAAMFKEVARARALLDAHDRRQGSALVTSIGVAVFSYLATSLWLHDAYSTHFWILVGLGFATRAAAERDARAPTAIAPAG